jgi:hypothetical protein
LLEKSIEQHSTDTRIPSIETKGVFIQIIVQVLSAYGSLVSTEQPSFLQRGNSVNNRHKNMGRFSNRCNIYFLIDVLQALKFVVTTPTVGANFGTKLHNIANEWYQAIRNNSWSDQAECATDKGLWLK